MSAPALQERCREYLATRTSDYAFRCKRYRAVHERMKAMGFDTHDVVVDVGAGRQDFEHYLRDEGWTGRYVPIDGCIDGTDLDVSLPTCEADFYVAIELVEHLRNPIPLLAHMPALARKGVVATTPNPEVIDVIRCDPDHRSVVPGYVLEHFGYVVEREQLFNDPGDTLVACIAGRNAPGDSH